MSTAFQPVRAALFLAGIVLASAASADAGILVLKNGATLDGDVVSGTDAEVTFRVYGEATPRTFQRDAVVPSSWYSARAVTAGDDANAHLALATFCAQNDLIYAAEAELERAEALAPDLKDRIREAWAALAEQQAQLLVEAAKKAQAEGNAPQADQLAAKVLARYAKTKAAPAALEIHQQTQGLVAKRLADGRARTEALEANEWKQPLQQIHGLLDAAAKRSQDALHANEQSKQIEDLKLGISDERHAIAQLESIAVKAAAVPAVVNQAQTLRAAAVNDCVSMYLNLAEAYAARTSYVDARNVITEAQRIAPTDKRLIEYRVQLDQMAAASGGNANRKAVQR